MSYTKKLIIIISVLLSFLLPIFLLTSIEHISKKTTELKHPSLNNLEKLQVYTFYLSLSVGAFILNKPEVAISNIGLSIPIQKSRDSCFMLESPKIKSILKNKDSLNIYKIYKPLKYSKSDYIGSDSRVALALGSSYIKLKKDYVYILVPVNYGKTKTTLKTPLFSITVDEGLFYLLQKDKWLKPYNMTWRCHLKNN